jgi:hypothetical protein
LGEQATPLFGAWAIDDPWRYLGLVLASGLLIRVAAAALKATGLAHSKTGNRWKGEFWSALKGFGSSEEKSDDYWHPFLLGLFELGAFPVLMATDHWTFVGAWIGFKGLVQYSWWTQHRAAFNRFLIGTALVLLASYFLGGMVRLVSRP